MAPIATQVLRCRCRHWTPLIGPGSAVPFAFARRPFSSSTADFNPSTRYKRRHTTPNSHPPPPPPPPGTRSLQVLRRESASIHPALFFAATAGSDHLLLTEPGVLKHFSRFGAVEDVRMAKDPVTCRPQSWGLVQFAVHSPILPRQAMDVADDPIAKTMKSGEQVLIDGVMVELRAGVVSLRRDNAVETGIDHCGFRGFAASYKLPYRSPPTAAQVESRSGKLV